MHAGNRIPAEIVVSTKYGSSPSQLVGPSLWGYVYKSKEGHHYHRLIPIDDVPALSQRAAIAGRASGPRHPLVAPIADTTDFRFDGNLYFCVTYEVLNESSLTEVLRGDDPRARLWCVAKVLEALPSWWSANGEGLMLVPADVVFNGQWPYLLALPPLGTWPRLPTLLSDPVRITYLAPEILRSQGLLVEQRAIDVYACGAMALQALYSTDAAVSAERLLHQAATSTLYERDRLGIRIPPWMERVEHMRTTQQALFRAVDPDPRVRRTVDPVDVARRLLVLIEYFDPMKAAQEYRERGQLDQAISFASAVSQTENNDDLVMMAARIAAADLGRTAYALEQYERVIAAAPTRLEAYREQLQLLLRQDWSQALSENGDAAELSENVDLMVWRDYWMLPEPERRGFVVEAATFFMQRNKNDGAQRLLYGHIWQEGSFLWWEILPCLLYTETLLAEGRVADASLFLDGVRGSLNRMATFQPGDPRFLGEDDFVSYGNRMVHLDTQIRERLHHQQRR